MKTLSATMAAFFALSFASACGVVDDDGPSVDTGTPSTVEPVQTDEAGEPEGSGEVTLASSRSLGAEARPAEVSETQAPDAHSDETLPYVLRSTTSTEAEENEFMRLINEERTSRGLQPLKFYWDLQDDARAHSELMDDLDDLHHNPDLSDVTQPRYWSKLGENVGRGHGVASLHQAFMNSDGHRANILGDYTHVAVGVHHPGTLWVTVVFMKAKVDGLETTYGPFTDDDFNPHEAAIHKIWKAGLTYGCGGQSYCPNRTLTRGEMAAFLTRALQLPAESTDHFDDDDGTWYEASANAMFASGVTYGCGEREYCGADDVTRGQMAAFLTRAFQLSSSGEDHFDDDDGRYYERSANAMYEAGITYGCGERTYCGEDSLTRAQMASFLARAMNL